MTVHAYCGHVFCQAIWHPVSDHPPAVAHTPFSLREGFPGGVTNSRTVCTYTRRAEIISPIDNSRLKARPTNRRTTPGDSGATVQGGASAASRTAPRGYVSRNTQALRRSEATRPTNRRRAVPAVTRKSALGRAGARRRTTRGGQSRTAHRRPAAPRSPEVSAPSRRRALSSDRAHRLRVRAMRDAIAAYSAAPVSVLDRCRPSAVSWRSRRRVTGIYALRSDHVADSRTIRRRRRAGRSATVRPTRACPPPHDSFGVAKQGVTRTRLIASAHAPPSALAVVLEHPLVGSASRGSGAWPIP